MPIGISLPISVSLVDCKIIVQYLMGSLSPWLLSPRMLRAKEPAESRVTVKSWLCIKSWDLGGAMAATRMVVSGA